MNGKQSLTATCLHGFSIAAGMDRHARHEPNLGPARLGTAARYPACAWSSRRQSHVTSLTFGDLHSSCVTSASLRLSPAARAAQPDAAHILAFDSRVTGLPEPEFLG